MKMNKIIAFLLLLTTGYICCDNTERNKLGMARKYYAALDSSNVSGIASLLTDSLLTREIGYDYEQVFSLEEYIEWVKWDSVFEPTYEILEMALEEGNVRATISKIDKRISFLHEEPIVTSELIRFDKRKIVSIERTNLIFNDSVFVKNRGEFLSWIDLNHPELNGFIHEQTKKGGLKYLKAIQLYESKPQKN